MLLVNYTLASGSIMVIVKYFLVVPKFIQSCIKDGVERYFFLLELERRLLMMNIGIINNG